MAFNDPIAELLTQIRNATAAQHRYVDVHVSKIRVSIVKILQKWGFVENFLIDEEQKKMRIFLKYNAKRQSVIHGLRRMSTPGARKYIECGIIPRVRNGFGIAILSTSKGILDDQAARENRVGGEFLCTVW